MSLPVITNVYRCTLPWIAADGVAPVNVFHVKSATAETASAVGTAIGTLLGSVAHLFASTYSAYQLNTVEVLPLDGSSATEPSSFSTTGGGATGSPIPSSAALVKFGTGLRGSAHRGRLYLGPVGESAVSAGQLDDTPRSQMQTAWDAFWGELIGGTPSLELCVASYKHASAAVITSLLVETPLGTQRRRQDQVSGS